jgi:hypothetical protein
MCNPIRVSWARAGLCDMYKDGGMIAIGTHAEPPPKGAMPGSTTHI